MPPAAHDPGKIVISRQSDSYPEGDDVFVAKAPQIDVVL
jgi:hypothetical protein